MFLKAKAICTIRHEVAYDFDEKSAKWVYRVDSEQQIPNLITDAGRVALHTYVYGTTAQRTAAGLGTGLNYVALSANGDAPAAGDTTLTGELSGNGLDRAQGTVTLAAGAGTVTTVQRQFTYAGAMAQAVQKTALFDAASNGKMAHEILFASRTLNQNDVLTVTFSITIA